MRNSKQEIVQVFDRAWILGIIANKLNWILADPVEAIWGSASSPESLSKQSSALSLNLMPHQKNWEENQKNTWKILKKQEETWGFASSPESLSKHPPLSTKYISIQNINFWLRFQQLPNECPLNQGSIFEFIARPNPFLWFDSIPLNLGDIYVMMGITLGYSGIS